MKFDRDDFQESFKDSDLPQWNCPTCKKGKLVLDGEFTGHELMESQKYRENPEWQPEDLKYKVHGDLKCTNKNCEERITIAGKVITRTDVSEGNWVVKEFIAPEYFYPYLELFVPPADFPYELEEPLEDVFKLFWVDKSACVNAMRKLVEALLTERRIKKTVVKRNKRLRLVLHERIKIFSQKNKRAADYLLAIKWIGNHGSHSSEIWNDDLLDGIELLQKVIILIYSDEDGRLDSLARDINKKKRPVN